MIGNFLTNLFGQKGKVRFEVETDGKESYVCVTDFAVFNMSYSEFEKDFVEKAKRKLYVENGIKVKNLLILGVYLD
jgi:hypothetical protein